MEPQIVSVDPALLIEAVRLTARDGATPRSAVQYDILMERFIADLVAESESLEGHETSAADVLDAARALAS